MNLCCSIACARWRSHNSRSVSLLGGVVIHSSESRRLLLTKLRRLRRGSFQVRGRRSSTSTPPTISGQHISKRDFCEGESGLKVRNWMTHRDGMFSMKILECRSMFKEQGQVRYKLSV